jgi:predicted TIM-barrel fold metal-dependent hydrolase
MELDLKSIEGIIVKNAVEEITNEVLHGEQTDVSGQAHREFTKKLDAVVKRRVDAVIQPMLEKGLDDLLLQATNSWGEQKGGPKTFAEFVTETAHGYLFEQVGWNGKKADSYASQKMPRLAYLVREAAKAKIEEAVRQAAIAVRDQIGGALGDMVESEIKQRIEGLRTRR